MMNQIFITYHNKTRKLSTYCANNLCLRFLILMEHLGDTFGQDYDLEKKELTHYCLRCKYFDAKLSDKTEITEDDLS